MEDLRARFEAHEARHLGIRWEDVYVRLAASESARAALRWMEETGGEPDVIGRDGDTGTYLICDCSAETPTGRRNVCYDRDARTARKRNPPASSAIEMAEAAHVSLAGEREYQLLQSVGEFDLKTSSWVATPPEIRERGGALFCERRYGRVFTFHNGADSYYRVRGFRVVLRV